MNLSGMSRGDLFVKQEELEKKIKRIQAELGEIGGVLTNFGQRLVRDPERVTFSNAPSPLGNIPMELLGAPTLEWRSLSQALVLEPIGQRIQDLREAQSELRQVERALQQER